MYISQGPPRYKDSKLSILGPDVPPWAVSTSTEHHSHSFSLSTQLLFESAQGLEAHARDGRTPSDASHGMTGSTEPRSQITHGLNGFAPGCGSPRKELPNCFPESVPVPGNRGLILMSLLS